MKQITLPEGGRRRLEEQDFIPIEVIAIRSVNTDNETEEPSEELYNLTSLLESWELVKLDENGFEVKLKFREAIDVSQYDEPDLLFI